MTSAGGARHGEDTLALCYHVVSDGASEHPHAVRRQVLERQLRLLLRRGYRGVTFTEAVLRPPPGPALAVTFDDAETSVHETALEALARLGLPGTVFVPTAAVGRRPTMDWPELRELAAAGWEIGSHSHTHARLTDLDGAALERELRGSRELLEDRLGRPCTSLAYPFGALDERVLAAARAAGYAAGATTRGSLRGEPLAWPRVGVNRGEGMLVFRVKVARQVRRLRGTRAEAAVAAAARLVRARA